MIDELIFEILNSKDFNQYEAVQFLNDLADDAKNNKNWAKELKRCIIKGCIEKQICPNCGSDFQTKTEKAYLADAWGKPIYEDITYDYCPDCGWNNKKEV